MLLPVLAALALFTGAASAAAPPSFTGEQLVGTLSDDFWEPTTAADPHSSYVYQAVTAIGSHECTNHNCPGTSIKVRASSDGGGTASHSPPALWRGADPWRTLPASATSSADSARRTLTSCGYDVWLP